MVIRMWKTRKVPGNPLVSMVVASYLREDERRWSSLMCLVWSLMAQTYQNWEVVIVHDGRLPPDEATRRKIERLENISLSKVRFLETPERRAKFGHPWREYGIKQAKGKYICLSNDDNLYAPVFVEALVAELVNGKNQFAYCDMIHSHQQWRFFSTQPRKSKLDLGAWIADGDLVRSTPWTDFSFSGDGTFIEALVKKAKGVVKVPSCLFVHN